MSNEIALKIKKQKRDTFGIIKIDGLFANSVSETMKEHNGSMTDETVETVFHNAVKILNYCPNPNYDKDFKRTGIVIGKVQSGKTSNFIALLALAFDNGYNLAVVLGGNTTELLTQNVERIERSFGLASGKIKVLHSKKNQNLLEPDKIRRFIDSGQKVIIVSLKSPQSKNNQHMSKVSKLFDDYMLASETTIIIDDEGDQATLNSKVYNKKNNIAETYKVATEIKNKIHRHCFISITATPQANILIKTADILSPDFGTLIYPGNGYCGLSVFHGEEQDTYVKVISDNEETLLDEGIPNSFIKAFASFFVGNAIRRARGDNKTHSMLIHPSQKRFDHQIVKNKVNTLLQSWRLKVKNLEDIGYRNTLRLDFLDAYNNFVNDGVLTREFEDLEKEIAEIIKNDSSDVLLFNSDEKNTSDNASFYQTRIYLGGNIMDRGITIEGLAVTYIFRRAKGVSNVDNTEQRARWFGYKNVIGANDYIDVCRVWATEAIKKDFASIKDSDEDMWTSIERNIRDGKEFKELPRIFKLQNDASHKLQLTRSSVQKTENFSWTEWKTQRYYIDSNLDSEFNSKLLENYVKDKSFTLLDYKTINKHKFYQNVDMGNFIDEVLSNFKFSENETLKVSLFHKLFETIRANKWDASINLMFLRVEDFEERKINDDKSIQQLFRGMDTKQNNFGEYNYLGDRSMSDNDPDKIQIQVHFIKPSKSDIDFYSPSLAFYIPEKYAMNLVRRSDK